MHIFRKLNASRDRETCLALDSLYSRNAKRAFVITNKRKLDIVCLKDMRCIAVNVLQGGEIMGKNWPLRVRKRATIYTPLTASVTLPNADRFSKFFHHT